MNIITLRKSEYDLLKKRASLYEAILKSLPERRWGIEEYTDKRVKELMKEDRISSKMQSRLRRLLRQR